jgi:voltage-gated potassium channel
MLNAEVLRDRKQRAALLERYERASELPLTLLALAIIPLIVLPMTADLGGAMDETFFAVDWIIWGIFAVDLVFRTSLVEQRRRYLIAHWYDVLIVAIPFLRPLRVLRSARALRLLRLTRAMSFMARFFASVRELGRRRGLAYVLSGAVLLTILAAALVFVFERNGDGTIDDFGTALWWAVVTIASVGYGDAVPVTPEGRAIAVFLMILGISLFGFVTASVAAFLVEQTREHPRASLDDVMAKLEELERELQTFRREQRGW